METALRKCTFGYIVTSILSTLVVELSIRWNSYDRKLRNYFAYEWICIWL